MGNCQAIDNASLVIQQPNGKSKRLYSAITAGEVMKLNPGHYVALILTTTTTITTTTTTITTTTTTTTMYPSATRRSNAGGGTTAAQPRRVTRIKLLRHTDSLTVGNIYRLITTKEVMKGLMAKKKSKTSNNIIKPKHSEEVTRKHEPTAAVRSNQLERTHQQMRRSENNRGRIAVPVSSSGAAMKPRGWHPSLNSISEASN